MMDPRQFAEWLRTDIFLPVVLVIGSEAAKSKVREAHGLSLAELFAPFGGQYRKLSASYQVLDRHMRADSLHVRFADADSASQWSVAHADKVGSWMVESSAPASLFRDARTALTPPTPWYEQWRLAICRSLRWSEHEGIDQPCAVLLVASSKEKDPVQVLQGLLNAVHMPPLCQQGVLEPVPARAVVLLHDLSDAASPQASELEAKLQKVRAEFQPHPVVAVKLGGSPTAEASTEVQALFRPHVTARGAPPPPPAPAGAAGGGAADSGASGGDGAGAAAAAAQPGERLTKEDLDSLAHAAAEVITRSAVPWMEMQLQQLENQIAQSRKGFKNQLKYLWRKPRESEGGKSPRQRTVDGDNPVYSLQTVEGQMRMAGDLTFLLRDYDTACGYYRNVVNDFKQDRSFKHAAGAYEFWGICSYITGQARSEWTRCMESAYDHYLSAQASRHAMRCLVLHQAMASDCAEIGTRFMKVNMDLPDGGLRNALAYEQAGQWYCQAGLARKGAFHVVLAGHTFNKLGFKRLALFSYQAVASTYMSKHWNHITDHFQFTMGRQAFGLGLLEESMMHFTNLLNSFTTSDKRLGIHSDRENTYIKEFQFVVKSWTEKQGSADAAKRTFDIQIPSISPQILVLLPCDETSSTESPPLQPQPPAPPTGLPQAPLPQSGPDGDKQGEQAAVAAVPWDKLAERVQKDLSSEERQELQWRSTRSGRTLDVLQRSVSVGAQVFVELELTNPMRVAISLSRARLGGDLAEADGSVPTSEAAVVDFPALDLELAPLETRKVRLVAVPRREGLLTLRSVSWSLFGQVACIRPLQVKGRRLRATVEQRASPEGVYGQDHRLELRVRSGLPQLQAQLDGWPASGSESLLQGELRSCTLVIRTGGEQDPVSCRSRLRILASHPASLAFAVQSASASGGTAPQMAYAGDMLTIEACAEEAAWSELRIPATLRGDQVGRHQVRVCLLAEPTTSCPEGRKPKERRQWVTLEESLVVRPSLSVSLRPSPSYRQAGRVVLAVSLENRAAPATEPLEVCGVRCAAAGEGGEQGAAAQDRELVLEDCTPSGAGSLRLVFGQAAQLLFALAAEASGSAAVATGEVAEAARGSAPRLRLLAASRAAVTAAAPSSRSTKASGGGPAESAAPDRVDLVVSWRTQSGLTGECYALQVPCERPALTSPCPLEVHILAPDTATLGADALVPVTLRLRNTSAVGPVSCYFSVEHVPEFQWLGCERSEVVKLPPLASHTAELLVYFPAAGVYNVNRFRFFVVAMPPVLGAMPASEQAPLAFGVPVERLVHVRPAGAEEKASPSQVATGDVEVQAAAC